MIRAVLFDWGGTLVEPLPGGRYRAVDGAAECLRALAQHVRLGIVTNETALSTERLLAVTRDTGIEAPFAVVASPTTARAAKPSPAIFTWAVQALGCPAAEVVMVGDGYEPDICGAKAAGLRTIWFNPHQRGRGASAVCEDVEVDALEAVPGIIAKWSASNFPGAEQ